MTEKTTSPELNNIRETSKTRKFVNYSIFGLFGLICLSFIYTNPSADALGWYTIIPSIFVITCIFLTKQIMPAYILGGFMGTYMAVKGEFFTGYFYTLYDVVMSDSYVWLVLVCGLMSALMVIIEKSGGAVAFSRWVERYAQTEKSSLLWAWILGFVIFIDDYLSCLVVGPSFSQITDKYKTSREMLSYVVDAMAAAPCVLIPISTWAAFCGGLFEINGYVEAGEGIAYFIKTIPYSFYAWICILIVPLTICNVIPTFGPLKKAEKRAKETGVLAPAGSEKIDMLAGQDQDIPDKPKIMNLFLPLIILVVATIYFEIDLFMGVLVAIAFTFVFYMIQRIMTVEEFMDSIVVGFRNMLFLFVLVAFSYSFTATLSNINFAPYVVENVKDYLSPSIMPFILFFVFGITEFMTGTNWDLYMITFPIILPLSEAIGANTPLCVAAIISAGVFGSHVCIASDATLCTSASTGCDNYEHTITQMPYAFIGYALTAIAYIIAGIVL